MSLQLAKAFLKAKLPFTYSLYLRARNPFLSHVFTKIYKANSGVDPCSVSGPGSKLAATETIRIEIPRLIPDLGLETILDIPCGDHLWMNLVGLGTCKYIGADIVKELIQENSQRYAGKHKQFLVLDITKDHLPAVDLILCRDCLVHLSFRAIKRALRNIKSSGSKYLLTTTFPSRARNEDVRNGLWRVLNLQAEPFNFPEPMSLITEDCKEAGGAYKDKSLGLWLVQSIPTARDRP